MHAWPEPFVPELPGNGIPLRLFDTVTKQVRPTAPGPTAKIYVCGITPYDATHIGHAATYLAFDLVNRQWRDNGHAVEYAQNITDVDDPLLERATATGVPWQELAHSQIQLFREDMTELRVIPPQYYEGVVDSLPAVVSAIETLIERGAAYQVDDDWYFDVSSDPRFGSVAQLAPDEQLRLFAERGGDPDRPGKRHPLDALLWRAARDGEPSWESAIGAGRPGWHIECVAIALHHLGMSFDVQGGGTDLIFPHHEMGASHADAITGQWPYARLYVHTGMVGLDGEKMSKSRGNLVFVSRLIGSGVDPMAIRLALLTHHYRDDWQWTDDDLVLASARLNAWRAAVSPPTGPSATATLAEVRRALADDLDTSRALRAIDAWAEEQRVRPGDDPSGPGIISRLADALLGVAL
ncbi:MAG: cysteine--1-D-myo-inosityl 2-amino-2-deoxy-alpha-D-glucopyranoside ligase [Candidatus Nanopelagicales bacterium]